MRIAPAKVGLCGSNLCPSIRTVTASERATQTELGAAVGTSQAQIARIEKGDADCRISSVERYAAALGFEVRYRVSA